MINSYILVADKHMPVGRSHIALNLYNFFLKPFNQFGWIQLTG